MEGNDSYDSMNSTAETIGQDISQLIRNPFIIYTFVVGPLLLTGLVGNAVAFRTFGKLRNQNVTTFLLRVLAIADSSVLLVMGGITCTRCLYMVYFPSHTVAKFGAYIETCFQPIYDISIMVNVWTSVVIGMNRYVALCRPLEAASFCTIRRARKHTLCIVLVSIAYGLPHFFDYKVTNIAVPYDYRVRLLLDNIWYVEIYKYASNIIFRFLVPFCILLFFVIRIAIALRASRRQRLDRHGGQLVDTKVTSMLFVLLTIFLVCHDIVSFLSLCYTTPYFTFHYRSIFDLPKAVPFADIPYILNSSVNVLIYFVYLKEFRRILCDRCINRLRQNQDCELSWSMSKHSKEKHALLAICSPLCHDTNHPKLNKQFQWQWLAEFWPSLSCIHGVHNYM